MNEYVFVIEHPTDFYTTTVSAYGNTEWEAFKKVEAELGCHITKWNLEKRSIIGEKSYFYPNRKERMR